MVRRLRITFVDYGAVLHQDSDGYSFSFSKKSIVPVEKVVRYFTSKGYTQERELYGMIMLIYDKEFHVEAVIIPPDEECSNIEITMTVYPDFNNKIHLRKIISLTRGLMKTFRLRAAIAGMPTFFPIQRLEKKIMNWNNQ